MVTSSGHRDDVQAAIFCLEVKWAFCVYVIGHVFTADEIKFWLFGGFFVARFGSSFLMFKTFRELRNFLASGIRVCGSYKSQTVLVKNINVNIKF